MHLEWVFKLSFVLLFAGAVAIQIHYQRMAGTYREGVAKHTEGHLAHEAKSLLIIRPLLGLPWYGVVLGWFLAPQWISWFIYTFIFVGASSRLDRRWIGASSFVAQPCRAGKEFQAHA